MYNPIQVSLQLKVSGQGAVKKKEKSKSSGVCFYRSPNHKFKGAIRECFSLHILLSFLARAVFKLHSPVMSVAARTCLVCVAPC